MKQTQTWSATRRWPTILSAASLVRVLPSCHDEPPIPEISYLCGNEPLPEETPGAPRCGAGDPDLPPEPFNGGQDWPPPAPPAAACIVKAPRQTPGDRQVLDEPTGAVDMLDT